MKNKKNVQWRKNLISNWDGRYLIDLKQRKKERQTTKNVKSHIVLNNEIDYHIM
jgi:6-pyruvoyl-tetrahydropterin synthase